MSNDPQSLLIPFLNRGIVLKREIGALQPGEYYALNNVTSLQEGSLQVRLGSKRYSNAAALGVIHSFVKMNLGGADAADPRYIGDGSSIKRVTGPYSAYTNISAGLPLSGDRWEAAPYNAGTSGNPTLYIAHDSEMLRDDSTFAKLRRWGVPPPVAVPICGLADPSLANYPGLVVLTDQSAGGADRLTGESVAGAVVVNGSYYQITPTDMNGIFPGMYVQLLLGGVPGFVVVDSVTSTSFFAFCSGVPSGTIRSFANLVNTPAGPKADGTTYYQDFTANVDWSFGGVADNGYDTDDNIHVGLFVSDYTSVSEIRIRIFVNGSTTDYYEKAVAPPQTLSFAQGTQTATAAQIDRAAKITAANLGDTTFPDPITPDLQPLEAQTQNLPIWAEYDISKLDFLKVGNAGSGPLTWKNVTSVRIVVITNSKAGTPAFTVNVGAIYGIGGQGPDSTATPLANPYDYLFTFRDPITGAEGNPCSPMIAEAAVNATRRAIQVQCWGTDIADITGDPSLQGFGSIAIYRRGGTIADGDWHFVGYAANPGVDGGGAPLPVVFIDNQPDFQIAGNKILEFDNFMPVPSDLPVPFTATIATIGGFTGPGFYTITFSNVPGPSADLTLFMKQWSEITIGKGTNQEIATVRSSSAGSIVVWLQRAHFAGELCSCDFMQGAPCDIVCQVGDALLVAGDKNNPHKVYRSKAGRPHAFPVKNEATGNIHILNVGSPSNPINGLVEFNGEVVSLNRNNIYAFQIVAGAMSQPIKTQATRGLVGKHLWCKVDDSIWYLSYDGEYAWAGGASVSVTEPIRFIFDQSQTIENGLQPLDFTHLEVVHLEYFSKYVYLTYIDLGGDYRVLRCSILDNYRWELFQYLGTANQFGALTTLFTEVDTGRFIGCVFDNNLGSSFLTQLELGTSDAWTAVPGDGTGIPWSAQTGFFPSDQRDLSKLFTDVVIEIENPSDTVTLKLLYDFSATPDVTDQFTITAAVGRRFIPLPLQQSGAPKTTQGKEAKVVGFLMSGTSLGKVVIYSLNMKWKPLAEIQRGRIGDWDDLGHPNDKRMYQVTIEGDCGANAAAVIALDIKTGIDGSITTQDYQFFNLPPGASGRFKETFPILYDTVVKMVRLRPQVQNADFKIFDVKWQKQDDPADIFLFGEWADNGYDLDKYLQQVLFDVDTNGVDVQVVIQGDGANLETVTVNTTAKTRSFTATLNSQFRARRFNFHVNIPLGPGAKFKMWSVKYVTTPADKGPIAHTSDWKDFENPNDKHLDLIWVDYENSGGTVVLQLDVLSGIGRTVESDSVATFTLSGATVGRFKQQFALPDTIPAGKAFRLRPVPGSIPNNPSLPFRIWDWTAHFEQWPADIILWTPWNDFGYPHLKYSNELVLDVDTGGVPATVQLLNETGAIENFTVTSTSSTREVILTTDAGSGKKWRLLITPGANGKFQMWSWLVHFTKADLGPVEHTDDWRDFGSPNDKHLKYITIEYENAGGAVTLSLDALSGISVTTEHDSVATFALPGAGTGRIKQQFAVPDSVAAAKSFRLHPLSSTIPVGFRMWGWDAKFEEYPADIVLWTELTDFGYEHLKYANELVIDVDTAGVAASVQLMNESGIAQTFSVNSTFATREVILTCNPQLAGKKWRLLITPGIGGKFQMWSWKVGFTKADEGPVIHSFDWSDLDYPYSKRLEDVVLHWDNGGTPFTMLMDILSGDGTVQQIAAFSFVLAGSGRSKKSFPFPDNTFATMIRLYPQSTITTLRHWAYQFKKYDLPPDTSLFTEPDNLGWDCEKVLRGFTLDIDTGGVNCTVALMVDGVQQQTFVVNSNVNDRVRILTVNPNQLGRLFHLTFAPGVNGKAQLFQKPAWDAWREPCYRNFWDSGEIVLGAAGWRYLKDIFLEYTCLSGLTFSIYRDGGTLFYSASLPAHAQRDVEQFFLPAINGTALNKSRRYRFTITATDQTKFFKVYGDGSRIESKLLSNDQRQSFEEHLLWAGLSPKTG